MAKFNLIDEIQLEIKFCQQCGWFLESGYWCGKVKKRIDINVEQGFPDWCPLPNAPNTPLHADRQGRVA